MLPLLLGLLLVVASSVVKMRRVVRTAAAPVALRGGAVVAWIVGTLAVGVLPAFAALALLDLATGLVRLDGGREQLGAALLWVGICDVANVGRLVQPRPDERGTDADLTRDRPRLVGAALVATAAYTVALLIAVGFVDGGHVAPGVAAALGLAAAVGTVRGRPGGPGMGPLTRRPIDPGATDDPDDDRAARRGTDPADPEPRGDEHDPGTPPRRDPRDRDRQDPGRHERVGRGD